MGTDCFACPSPKGKCIILKTGIDCQPDCPFRKTKTRYVNDQRKAARRLSRLPEDKQRHIAKTYYNDKRPWLTAEEMMFR